MPVIDASSLDGENTDITCDICIVGGGAAGIYLGVRLVKMGISVVIVEAGGRVCTEGTALGIDTDFEGTPYRGALEGRAFGLGGSTSRWGGVLVPYSERDYRTTEHDEFDPWQHIVREVEQNSSAVLKTLGFDSPFDTERAVRDFIGSKVDALHACGLELRLAQYLPFRRKNFARLLNGVRDDNDNLKVFLHLVGVKWQIQAGPGGLSRIQSVTAKGGSRTVTIDAGSFVLAAGALESARILLEMEQDCRTSPFRSGAAIGHYLGDHVSCAIANVDSEDEMLAAELFAPRFAKGRMWNFRLLEHSAPGNSPRNFAHFIFDNLNPGFQLAKKVLGSLQARSLPELSLIEFSSGITGLLSLGWNRIALSRLYIAPGTPVHLQLDIEQHLHHSNHIRLGDRKDSLGRPVPVIHWEIKEDDWDAIGMTSSRIFERWAGKREGLPELIPVFDRTAERKPHDTYHPVGVCKMGVDRESVVDPELRVHGTQNLSVLSTAVFPSAGTANPTFSMLCLAEMLAERLQKESKRK